MKLTNEQLAELLDFNGIGFQFNDSVRIPDEESRRLWNEAVKAQEDAAEKLAVLRTHLKLPPPKPGHYCGCCEAWHE